ncbi:sialate O-acetylesterase [Vibrio sp. 11-4(1)]|uniref:sialate O-acetylesterase n=1 Tax=Vibrio sp. 11-4(1) TaxID=2591018 RepID=UPI00148288A6|nr:sialate O-acetylesterase [Vibrio sp. 11-4(1)]NNN82143.1 sialate O-acetylesterase [Vibrio sp. 11-4(1)]
MTDSNNFFQLIERHSKNLDWLNQILKGGVDDSIIIDGVSKPSISKDIANHYSEIKAMVVGRATYETKSGLPASPPSGVILAEVWRDPVRNNNGLYGWTGSEWEKSPYDSTKEFVDMVDVVRADLGDAATSHQQAGLDADTNPLITDNGEDYAGGITDAMGRMIVAFGLEGAINIFTKLSVNFAEFKTKDDRAGIATKGDDDVRVGVSSGGAPFMDSMEVHQGENVEYAIMDESGRMAFILYSDGSIETVNQRVSASPSDYAWSVQDSKGRVALMVNPDGTVDFLPSDSLVSKIVPEDKGEFIPLLTEHNHIIMHGQSLSVALGSRPAITPESTSGALMPDYGFYDGNSDASQGLESGPPKSTGYTTMTTLGDASMGNEVPTAGACEQLQKMLNDEFSAGAHVVIGSNNGHGGYKIDQLDKEGVGTGPTPNYLLGVEQSELYKKHSANLGKHCLTQAMLWMQGETDVSQGTTKQEYKRRLENLISDYAKDIKQGYHPALLTYQVGSHTKRMPNATSDVPVAQWELSNENPYVFMVCPTYVFPYNSDGVHLPSRSSQWIGCYFGKVLFNVLTGKGWKPVQPERINRQENIVLIDFHVPKPPLVIDTTLITDPGDYGFEVWEGDNQLTIKSVSVVSGTQVKLVLNEIPSSIVQVRYAMGVEGQGGGPTTGPRGNIRDSDDTVAVFNDQDGQPFSLFNWCVIFIKNEDK